MKWWQSTGWWLSTIGLASWGFLLIEGFFGGWDKLGRAWFITLAAGPMVAKCIYFLGQEDGKKEEREAQQYRREYEAWVHAGSKPPEAGMKEAHIKMLKHYHWAISRDIKSSEDHIDL